MKLIRGVLVAACLCAAVSFMLTPAPASAAPAPEMSATGAILLAPRTGQVLYSLNADREVAIASTTKLMTALITLEHARLGQVFADPDYVPAASDSQLGLQPGERMSVHDLLLAMLLPSADDAAEDLAYNVGHGSVARFVAMMNRRARQLGLDHTHYSTPIGLDTPGNYSTASDLVKLADYDLRTQPFFRRAVALPSAVLHTGDEVRTVVNRNDLVDRVPWISGVKTGHTNAAGYVLVGSARRDGMTLLSAVLGTASEAARDENTLTLLDYGYADFRTRTPIRAGAVLARPTVKDQPGKRAVVIASRTFMRVVPTQQPRADPRVCPAPAERPTASARRRRDGRGDGRPPSDRQAAADARSGPAGGERVHARGPLCIATLYGSVAGGAGVCGDRVHRISRERAS